MTSELHVASMIEDGQDLPLPPSQVALVEVAT